MEILIIEGSRILCYFTWGWTLIPQMKPLVMCSTAVDFQEFLGLYKRLFNQCRSVVRIYFSNTFAYLRKTFLALFEKVCDGFELSLKVTQESSDVVHLPNRFNEEKMSTVPASKVSWQCPKHVARYVHEWSAHLKWLECGENKQLLLKLGVACWIDRKSVV